MINLLDYLAAEDIRFLPDQPYEAALDVLMRHCLRESAATMQQTAVTAILARSRSRAPQDINLGKGFGLAHTRLRDLDRIRLAIGLLSGARKCFKGDPVHTLLALAIPESQSRPYLSLLARLGRLLERDRAGEVFEQAGRLAAGGAADTARQAVMAFVREFENG